LKKFIYCSDEKLKDDLLSKNFKIIQTFDSNNAKVWVFENSQDINKYILFNKNADVVYSNNLYF